MSLTKKQQDWFYYICIAIFGLLSLFLHLYKLEDLPYAINIDEAGLWYNVQCLLNYGTDQANNSWPVLFANYYGEQSALYTYLAFLFCKLLGESLFVIRLPAVLGSCLIFVFGLKVVDNLYKNHKINILFCALYTIFPYFTIAFRTAMDCNLMLSFSTMFLWFFIKAIDTKQIKYAIIAGISCGLVLYTYAISYVTIPLFLLISIIYLTYFKRITWNQVISFVIPIAVLAIPLLLVQIINMFNLQELTIFNITFTKFEHPRHSDVGFENILAHLIVFTNYIFCGNEVVQNTSILLYNFYIISIPFCIFGIVSFIKDLKSYSNKFFLLIWGIATFVTLLLIKQGVRDYQANAIMFVILIFIMEGVLFLFQLLKSTKFKKIFCTILIILYTISFLFFISCYYLGEYNDNVYELENAQTDLTEVFEILDEDDEIMFAVKTIYYKLAKEEDPTLHPFIYEFEYENGECIEIREVIYPYGNWTFDYYRNFSKNISPDLIYVVPEKDNVLISHMEQFDYFEISQVGSYLIYKPKK